MPSAKGLCCLSPGRRTRLFFAAPGAVQCLAQLGIPPELNTENKTCALSCFVFLQPPEQAKATLSSHHPYFPSVLSSHPHFFPHLLQRLEGRSLTCCCQTGELGSVQVQRKYRNSKWLWFKIYSSKKRNLSWSLGMTEHSFLIFAERTTHIKGEQYPPENFCIETSLKKLLLA